jgi:hypothetical protein
MADAAYSIVPTLRRLRAEGLPPERQLSIVLDDAARTLGRDGAAEWLAHRLCVADRVIERVRNRQYAERISALELRVAELESRK